MPKYTTPKDTLNVLVIVTEKRGNLWNDLNEDLLKALSSLRKGFANLKGEGEDKKKLIGDLEMKVAETNTIQKALQSGVGSNCRGVQIATIPLCESELHIERLESASFSWQYEETLFRYCGRQTTK